MGLTELNEIVEKVKNKEAEKRAKSKDQQPCVLNEAPCELGLMLIAFGTFCDCRKPMTQYLTAALMIKWIDENKVVSHIIGKGAHHELVRK